MGTLAAPTPAISPTTDEYRQFADILKTAYAAVIAARDAGRQVSNSRSLPRSFRASASNLLSARFRLRLEMSRQYGEDMATELFFGDGWAEF